MRPVDRKTTVQGRSPLADLRSGALATLSEFPILFSGLGGPHPLPFFSGQQTHLEAHSAGSCPHDIGLPGRRFVLDSSSFGPLRQPRLVDGAGGIWGDVDGVESVPPSVYPLDPLDSREIASAGAWVRTRFLATHGTVSKFFPAQRLSLGLAGVFSIPLPVGYPDRRYQWRLSHFGLAGGSQLGLCRGAAAQAFQAACDFCGSIPDGEFVRSLSGELVAARGGADPECSLGTTQH